MKTLSLINKIIREYAALFFVGIPSKMLINERDINEHEKSIEWIVKYFKRNFNYIKIYMSVY